MEVLSNGNITLLPLAEEHRDVFVELANMPEINSAVGKPFPYTEDRFEDQLEKAQEDNELFIWMIEHQSQLIGVINAADHRKVHLYQGGYWMNPAYWGNGLASEALLLVRDYLIQERHAERIQAVVEPSNVASIKVLEKCGYKREGLLKHFYPSIDRGLIDVFMYAYLPNYD